MSDTARVILLCIVAIALAGVVACVIVSAASAEQCGCPAPTEPPRVWQPLPALQPGGGYVWLAWVGK